MYIWRLVYFIFLSAFQPIGQKALQQVMALTWNVSRLGAGHLGLKDDGCPLYDFSRLLIFLINSMFAIMFYCMFYSHPVHKLHTGRMWLWFVLCMLVWNTSGYGRDTLWKTMYFMLYWSQVHFAKPTWESCQTCLPLILDMLSRSDRPCCRSLMLIYLSFVSSFLCCLPVRFLPFLFPWRLF